MRKEIIVNADEMESRVAILEDGRLAELHIEREPRMVGNIYKARVVSVLPGMDAAFADIGLDRNVFLCADDVGFVTESGVTSSGAPRSWRIAQRLKEKQQVVVQIVRAPVGGKGARATTRLALPGRYLVLLLSDDRAVGVSRKIEDRKERDRLRKIGEQIRPDGLGLIIRTEAEGRGKGELRADLRELLDLRDRLMAQAADTRAPALLHQDLTLTYQVIRDAFTDDVNALIVDAKGVYDNAVELVKHIAPHLRRRIKRYRGKPPIFHKHGVEEEIDRLLRRRVWLQVGGYISIDQAEAFTAIDVNTGRYTGSSGLAETILRTNLEAADEIARQIRLRDLGGIIVIDFIDMENARHRQRVNKAFQEGLKRDRQKSKILHLSPLGLVEMTRKRRGESLMGIITETCPQCGGLGRVRSSLTVALKIERETQRLASEERPEALILRAAPAVAALLVGEEGLRAAALEKSVGRPVYVRADERLGREEHEITPTTLARASGAVRLFSKGDAIKLEHLEPRGPAAREGAYGWCEGYRVHVEGAPPADWDETIILMEAGHSFGRGRPEGAQPKPEPEREPKPAGKEKKAKLRRPRGGRKRSRAARKRKAPAPAAQEATAAAPKEAAAAPEPAPAPAAEMPAEPEAPKEAAGSAKGHGLLRRGARRILRPRR